jgi:hypothetical protein
VAQATAQVDAHVLAKALAAKDGRMARTAARVALRARMKAVARTARDIARTTPGIENKIRMETRLSDVALLDAARRFVSEAATMPDRFVTLGLPATFVEDLRNAADAFEGTMADRRTGRSTVAASQAGITAALKSGVDAALTLDVIVANTVGHDPVLMAAWERDRRLVDGKGKPEPSSAPVVTPALAPVTGEGLKQAS